jgi:lipopolysaccharide export system protein LptA
VRFTIERIRTLVLAAGVLLVGALVVFLAVDKWKQHFNLHEVLKPLGVDIQQEANGYTLSHAFGAHSQYKIHASKVVQLKDNRAILHDVKIELYDTEGGRVDRIEGNEFEYDQKTNTATAAGPVEITLMRPGVAPAIAPKATPEQAVNGKSKILNDKSKAQPLAAAAQTAATGEIHVKTSGLTFNQQTGVATTSQRVDFSMVQGTGSSMGATYDSKEGRLVLDRAVELNTLRAGDTVVIHAEHAEFEHVSQECQLHAATAEYRKGVATAGDAKILFREDGSVVRLDAVNGFTLTTATGSHLAAPKGSMDFNERNQPRHGHLEGGVQMDSVSENGSQSRQVHGTSPTAELEFTAQGNLRHAHMERGVEMHSEELSQAPASNSKEGPLRVRRTWRSPVADVDFRDAGHGKVEPARMNGTQGVVVTGESQRGNGAVAPSRLAADAVTGEFGPGSAFTAMTGTGHASMEETSATGTRETASGDRLDAHFADGAAMGPAAGAKAPAASRPGNPAGHESGGAAQIQSAVLDGHVVLTQEPAAKPGAQAEAPMRATAGHAVYEGTGEWLHLTVNPRVEDGGLQLTADKVDVSQATGDAFAHGNVKATWIDNGSGDAGTAKTAQQSRPAGSGPGQGSVALGGKGPAHAISAEAQLHQATGEVTFRGHARLWQQANSVAGPVIVLDRQKQTLVSRSTDPAEPVRAVLLSAGGPSSSLDTSKATGKDSGKDAGGKSAEPSVIRVRGGDLKYSDAEHKAVMHGGALGTVVAETGAATSVSNEVELLLLPPGNHAGKDGGQAQVDRLTARGHVTLTSEGRHGTGEQLVYTSESGEYVLTGTASAPPRMTDPARGNVTGEALIFHSRDDSVSVEGGGRKTTTETTAPK